MISFRKYEIWIGAGILHEVLGITHYSPFCFLTTCLDFAVGISHDVLEIARSSPIYFSPICLRLMYRVECNVSGFTIFNNGVSMEQPCGTSVVLGTKF